MARNAKDIRTRFHALWVLEGIGSLDAGLVKELYYSKQEINPLHPFTLQR
jgi:hypothetical protein